MGNVATTGAAVAGGDISSHSRTMSLAAPSDREGSYLAGTVVDSAPVATPTRTPRTARHR